MKAKKDDTKRIFISIIDHPDLLRASRAIEHPEEYEPQWMSGLLGLSGRNAIPIRQSMAGDAQDCWRLYALKHRYGLVPRGTTYNSRREIGTLVHLMVKELICGATFQQALQAVSRHIDDIMSTVAELAEESATTDPLYLEQIRASLLKDKGVAAAMTLVYWDKYTLDPQRWHPIAVEYSALIKVPGMKSPLKGTIDLLLWDRQKNEIWIHDIKTTSDDPAARQAISSYDMQTVIYRLMAEALVKCGKMKVLTTGEWVPANTPIVGVRYNVIKTPTIKQKVKWTPPEGGKQRPQTFEEYLAEVRDWYFAKGEHADTSTGGRFAMPEPYSDRFREMLISPEDSTKLRQLDRLSNTDLSLDQFPKTMNTKKCYGAYGNAPCPMLPLCTTPPAMWKHIVKTRYVQIFPDDYGELPDAEEKRSDLPHDGTPT